MQVANRWHATAGVALVGAGVIAVTPIAASLPETQLRDIALAAGGDDATDVVIDIVRHGQRGEDAAPLVVRSPPVPGAPLSEQGVQEAHEVAHELHDKLGDDVAGIFSGQGIRDIATAAPFADLEGMDKSDIQVLPGLNEIDGGIYGAVPHLSPASAPTRIPAPTHP
jgi:hypothetical protein